jgi:hypothetical protein
MPALAAIEDMVPVHRVSSISNQSASATVSNVLGFHHLPHAINELRTPQ